MNLDAMKERGGAWFAYQNMALDSSSAGHIKFLQCGVNRTFKSPPDHYPQEWKYLLTGKVNLKRETIDPLNSKQVREIIRAFPLDFDKVFEDMTYDTLMDCYMTAYKGMTIGIEKDGYIHS